MGPGHVVVVTGAAHGLGRAYARDLVGRGARVALLDVDAEAVGSEAGALGSAALALPADVTDPHAVAAAVSTVVERWDGISALVNNAGGALLPTAPFDTFSLTQWRHVLDVNLLGAAVCAAAVAPIMRAAARGSIVNVTSTTATVGRPTGLAPYIAAKAGIVGLTRALARELGPDNIRVNAISPGYVPVDTPKATHSPQAAAALRERMIAEQCLPRTETPQDLCGAVAFLCGPDSEFVTGQVLAVDGGWTFD